MTLEASFLVLALTILIQLFFALAVLSRSLTRATHFFAIQAGCLVAVFVTYALATGNHYLYIWAGIAAILAGWGLPYWPGGLLYSAKRMPQEERVSPIGTIIYLVLLVLGVLIVGSYTHFSLVIAQNPLEHLGQALSVNLVAALSLFLYGLIALLSQRHPFKMVLGLMMMTEGAHLTLVHLTPDLLEVVKIGILTQVIPSIFMVLYVNRLIAEKLRVTDTARLSELKY